MRLFLITIVTLCSLTTLNGFYVDSYADPPKKHRMSKEARLIFRKYPQLLVDGYKDDSDISESSEEETTIMTSLVYTSNQELNSDPEYHQYSVYPHSSDEMFPTDDQSSKENHSNFNEEENEDDHEIQNKSEIDENTEAIELVDINPNVDYDDNDDETRNQSESNESIEGIKWGYIASTAADNDNADDDDFPYQHSMNFGNIRITLSHYSADKFNDDSEDNEETATSNPFQTTEAAYPYANPVNLARGQSDLLNNEYSENIYAFQRQYGDILGLLSSAQEESQKISEDFMTQAIYSEDYNGQLHKELQIKISELLTKVDQLRSSVEEIQSIEKRWNYHQLLKAVFKEIYGNDKAPYLNKDDHDDFNLSYFS